MSLVWAVSMMKDEADVAAHTLRHMASEGVDGILVADNLSSDGTDKVLSELQGELACDLVVVRDEELAYYQSAKMSYLARLAHEEYGAHWIVPFDADEVWYAHDDRLAVSLRASDAHVVEFTVWNHYTSGLDDTSTGIAFQRMCFRDGHKLPLRKVAFRYQDGAVVGMGNHSVDMVVRGLDAGESVRVDDSANWGIRHFPYRGWEHFHRKVVNGAAAYAATDLDPKFGAHWRQYGEILDRHGEDALHEVYDRWFYNLSPLDAGQVYDPAPFLRWRDW